MKNPVFAPADILMPQVTSMEKWAVIACDQFTSQPEYWENVKNNVGDAVSSLHLILPEAQLESADCDVCISKISDTMEQYLKDKVFKEYNNAYIYVERTLQDGSIRKGLVGVVDLDEYDYLNGEDSSIRATEKTVVERIPPRKKIRENAVIELPHILLLCDDDEKILIEPISESKADLQKLYEFDLMEQGGHIAGFLVTGHLVEEINRSLEMYEEKQKAKYGSVEGKPLLFAVGDGNHSLATAKACYEDVKKSVPTSEALDHPARYALVELENIHDEAQKFEPIHRILKQIQPEELLGEMKEQICAEEGYPVVWYSGNRSGILYLDKEKGVLPVGILQSFLDSWLEKHSGAIDYIHGDDVLKKLAEEDDAIGFLLPPIEKGQLFTGIVSNGVLPRKTFSMGHAQEKRYYMEARKIK